MVQKRKRRNPWRDIHGRLVWGVVTARVVYAFILICLTWNPTGWSYLGLLASQVGSDAFFSAALLKIAGGACLTAGWLWFAFLVKRHVESRAVAIFAAIALVGFLLLQWNFGWSVHASLAVAQWLVTAVLAAVLGFAASGKELRKLKRRLG